MPWFVLIASALFEAVWATALGRSEHFTEAAPTTVFVVALAISMIGLGWAAKHIAIGTAYAVWTGLGAALTVAYAMSTGVEVVSVGKIVFITGIIAAVVGFKLLARRGSRRQRRSLTNLGESCQSALHLDTFCEYS